LEIRPTERRRENARHFWEKGGGTQNSREARDDNGSKTNQSGDRKPFGDRVVRKRGGGIKYKKNKNGGGKETKAFFLNKRQGQPQKPGESVSQGLAQTTHKTTEDSMGGEPVVKKKKNDKVLSSQKKGRPPTGERETRWNPAKYANVR